MTPNPNRWIPDLSGLADPQVEQFIRYLANGLYDVRDGQAGPGATQATAPTITGIDLVGSPPALIRKGPGAGTYTGFTSITLDENGRVVAIS